MGLPRISPDGKHVPAFAGQENGVHDGRIAQQGQNVREPRGLKKQLIRQRLGRQDGLGLLIHVGQLPVRQANGHIGGHCFQGQPYSGRERGHEKRCPTGIATGQPITAQANEAVLRKISRCFMARDCAAMGRLIRLNFRFIRKAQSRLQEEVAEVGIFFNFDF